MENDPQNEEKESDPQIEKLKELTLKKGMMKDIPNNGDEIIIIKEERMEDYLNYSIGAGNAIVINPRYFEVKGKIYSDTLKRFSDTVLRIEPKQIKETKGVQYFCSVFEPGLVRAIDEATWQKNFATIDDLISVLENLGKGSLKSMFDDLKT
ncbi:MAG: hypothetical protein ACTSRK_09780 [Promethearchaeota archaeon]